MVAEQISHHLMLATVVNELGHIFKAMWADEPVHAIQSFYDSTSKCMVAINAPVGCFSGC